MAWAASIAYESSADLRRLFPELEIDATSSLPPPPLAEWNDDDVTVAPLTSVTAFIDEGHKMRNCVAIRLPAVLDGDSALYHATIDGAGLTVELVQGDGRWRLAEAKTSRQPGADRASSGRSCGAGSRSLG